MDRGDELWRGSFRAAVVGRDQNVGAELFGVFEQFALGRFLDVGGEEDRAAAAG